MKKTLGMVVLLASWIGAEIGFKNNAQAGVFELGSAFSYQRSNFSEGAFTWTRRYSFSIGYYFTQDSEIEFSYQDSTTKTFVTGVQDVTFHDQVYSLDLNYLFLNEGDPLRPYVKMGIGQLNRDAEGTYQGGFSPPGRTDQVTAILGAGIKARLTSRFGLKAEATSYLTGGSIGTWRDNIALAFGGSYFF